MEDRPDLKGEHIMKGWNELCLIQRPNVLYALLSFKFCQGGPHGKANTVSTLKNLGRVKTCCEGLFISMNEC